MTAQQTLTGFDTAEIAAQFEGHTVEWSTWCGTARATVVSVSDNGIRIRCTDGFEDYRNTSAHTSLTDIVRRWTIVD
ncbi:hypothetical protein SEA_ASHERTHEMAN_17 [Gordonia phage Ashertheman]|uniref:Uncharacterized protein n=1 Tax=Gordonia phage Ashertheman TaxID=2301692 RepID=A0A385DU45_9CAUD|nr:hypothetical protein J1764_gp17 [Gordonia phage Ashertheman]AXQ62924.1 hypothetical protein SEA_ASHERTHEMAN_17 [Gordonia phage Ashertheman]